MGLVSRRGLMSNQAFTNKRAEIFIQSLTDHLKQLSRRVMRVDTTAEVLSYLADTLTERLSSDLIAIYLIEDDQLVLNTYRSRYNFKLDLQPTAVEDVNPLFFKKSLMKNREMMLEHDSKMLDFLEANQFQSWFTMPIADDESVSGLVLVAFQQETMLFDEMQSHFDELGSYLSVALSVIHRNQEKKQTMIDMQLLSNSMTFGGQIDELVSTVVNFSGRETRSISAAIYLFNDEKNQLSLLKPTYGFIRKDEDIAIGENSHLHLYFPHVEQIGYSNLAIPIMVDMKMIGVLYAEKATDHIYTGHDLEQLQMFANYFAVMYENMQLTIKENLQKTRLERLLKLQQNLLGHTVHSEGFVEINKTLGEFLDSSVILYDRFFNLIDFYLHEGDTYSAEEVVAAGKEVRKVFKVHQLTYQLEMADGKVFEVIPITDGSDVHAFIALHPIDTMDNEFLALTINVIKNFYSLQFIKQKIALDAFEQVKDNVVAKLLVPKIDNLGEVLENANLFNWDLYKPYRVSVVRLLDDKNRLEDSSLSLLDQKAVLNQQYKQIKDIFTNYNPKIQTAMSDDHLVIFTPVTSEPAQQYWQNLYRYTCRIIEDNEYAIDFVQGIGGIANAPTDYFNKYQQAVEASHVLINNPSTRPYAFFDDLGAYTILNELRESPSAHVFAQNYLKELYELSNNQQMDLFNTLKVYLQNNGSMKQTAEDLYLHRSTLNYRLDKIRDIMKVDIDDANERFNIMLSFKLLDLSEGTGFEE